ncbi:Uncharacterised protein [Mycobacteroides abscessus subsp. abscessus]|nr:Uncharacterised protein [Mycobacteroides abscessus subsp. abscessus]
MACTIAAARCAGLPDLKMPEPTNTPSAPSCIIIAASAGVAIPPAVNRVTGSLPALATSTTRSYGACNSFAATYNSSFGSEVRRRISSRILRMWVVAFETSPVPASPLERIIAAPSVMRRSASPRLVAPHTNGTVNANLSMWLA